MNKTALLTIITLSMLISVQTLNADTCTTRMGSGYGCVLDSNPERCQEIHEISTNDTLMRERKAMCSESYRVCCHMAPGFAEIYLSCSSLNKAICSELSSKSCNNGKLFECQRFENILCKEQIGCSTAQICQSSNCIQTAPIIAIPDSVIQRWNYLFGYFNGLSSKYGDFNDDTIISGLVTDQSSFQTVTNDISALDSIYSECNDIILFYPNIQSVTGKTITFNQQAWEDFQASFNRQYSAKWSITFSDITSFLGSLLPATDTFGWSQEQYNSFCKSR